MTAVKQWTIFVSSGTSGQQISGGCVCTVPEYDILEWRLIEQLTNTPTECCILEYVIPIPPRTAHAHTLRLKSCRFTASSVLDGETTHNIFDDLALAVSVTRLFRDVRHGHASSGICVLLTDCYFVACSWCLRCWDHCWLTGRRWSRCRAYNGRFLTSNYALLLV